MSGHVGSAHRLFCRALWRLIPTLTPNQPAQLKRRAPCELIFFAKKAAKKQEKLTRMDLMLLQSDDFWYLQ